MPYAQSQRRIYTEPRWRPEQRFTAADLPRATCSWLLDDGSLTRRLLPMGKFRVQRLAQGWQVPLPSEAVLLGEPRRQRALVREVVLRVDEQAVVFARSVFPASCLSGSLSHLKHLRNQSLGAILFRHPGMQRSPFELARMAGDADYLPVELRQQQAAWGRRSRFEIDGKRLLVSEVFLEHFRPWPALLPVHRTQRGKVSAAITPAKH